MLTQSRWAAKRPERSPYSTTITLFTQGGPRRSGSSWSTASRKRNGQCTVEARHRAASQRHRREFAGRCGRTAQAEARPRDAAADLPDQVKITTKQQLLNGVRRTDLIARSGDAIVYHRTHARFRADRHDGGMPPEVAMQGGFMAAIATVLPSRSPRPNGFLAPLDQCRAVSDRYRRTVPRLGQVASLSHGGGRHRCGLVPAHLRCTITCWLAGSLVRDRRRGTAAEQNHRPMVEDPAGAAGVRAPPITRASWRRMRRCRPRVCGWRPARHGAGMPIADDPRAGGTAADGLPRRQALAPVQAKRRLHTLRSGGGPSAAHRR